MVKKIAAIVCFVAGIGTLIWMQAKPGNPIEELPESTVDELAVRTSVIDSISTTDSIVSEKLDEQQRDSFARMFSSKSITLSPNITLKPLDSTNNDTSR